jgi:O-antigen biosynthesis protein
VPSLPRRVVRRARAGAVLAGQGPRQMVARRLAAAGLVDRDWYAQQSGNPWDSDVAAALHYLRTGRRAGWSLHPLLEPEWVCGDTWRTSRLDPAQLYLAGRSTRGGPSPMFDDAVYRAAAGGSATDPGGPLGHFLRHAPAGALLPAPSERDRSTATQVRRRMEQAIPVAETSVDWAAQRARGASRIENLTSVVIVVTDQWPALITLVDSALAPGEPADAAAVEVVLVLARCRPAAQRIVLAIYGDEPRVRWLQAGARFSTAKAWNAGLAVSCGDVVVLADARCTVRAGAGPLGDPWWAPLRRALDDPGVAAAAPLVLGPTGTVAGSGLGVHGQDPSAYPLFVDDAAGPVAAGGPFMVAALGDEVLAARAVDVVAVDGVDAGYIAGLWGADLSCRLAGTAGRSGRDGWLLVVPSVQVVAEEGTRRPAASDGVRLAESLGAGFTGAGWDEARTWSRLGVAVTGTRPAPGSALASPVLARQTVDLSADLPVLRWAIKIAAPSSEQGDKWGDVHFAADLAAALRRLGQHVAVDRRPAHERSTCGLDDVVLNLRGLATLRLRPDQVNLIWVISHPDQVDLAELRGYDRAFAASVPWSQAMTRAGVSVEPLLQATDPERFQPGLAQPDSGPAVLFVGNSRGVVRPIVRDALTAGTDLAVYGTRWSGFIDPAHVRGTYLANETVGAAYRAAGVVLNDHWPDMAAQGFVSNRVFDVVAAGGRVISDPVAGLSELFGGAVLEYRTPDDLARWTGPARDSVFPSPQDLLAISARVRAEHSFEARARKLLDAALTVRRRRRDAGPS